MDIDVARSIESLSDGDRAALLRFLEIDPDPRDACGGLTDQDRSGPDTAEDRTGP